MSGVKPPGGSEESPKVPERKKKEEGAEKYVPKENLLSGDSIGLKERVWTVYKTEGVFSAIMALFEGIFGRSKQVAAQTKEVREEPKKETPQPKAEAKIEPKAETPQPPPKEVVSEEPKKEAAQPKAAPKEKPKEFQNRINAVVSRLQAVQDASIESDPTLLYNYLADLTQLEAEIQGYEFNEKDAQTKQLRALGESANKLIDQRSSDKVADLQLPVGELQKLAGKAKVNIPSNKTFGETAKALRLSLEEKKTAIEAGNDERDFAFRTADGKLTAGKKQLEEKELEISDREKNERAETERELTKETAQKKEEITKNIRIEEEKIARINADIKKIQDVQYGQFGIVRGRPLSREEEGQISAYQKQVLAIRNKIDSEMELELLKVDSQLEASKILAFEKIEEKYQAERKALTEEIITPLEKQRKIAETAQNKARDEISGLRGNIIELDRMIMRQVADNKDKIGSIVRLQFYKEIFQQNPPQKNMTARAFIATHLNSTDKSPIYEYIRNVFGASSNVLTREIDDIAAQTMLK